MGQVTNCVADGLDGPGLLNFALDAGYRAVSLQSPSASLHSVRLQS
jgi:hypothetical protein